MIATPDNILKILNEDNLINLRYVYSYKSTRFWALTEDIHIKLSNGQYIVIPKNFETDLSTVPKWVWSIVRPFGDFLLAAIVHDYLYHVKILTRKQTDREMLFWSELINTNRLDNYLRYYVVRALGWLVWQKLI